MSGGLRFEAEDIRQMPVHMQEQVAMAMLPTLEKLKCDPRVFARCPYNGTCVSPDEAEFTAGSDCDVFNKRVLSTPVTNGDHIRTMSDMELAGFIHAATRACADRNCGACPIGDANCIVMLHWIRQPKAGW